MVVPGKETILLKVLSLKGAAVSQEMKDIQCSKHKDRGREGSEKCDQRGRQDLKQIMQGLTQLDSEFGHYSKGHRKAVKSFQKENTIVCIFKISLE